MHALPVCGRCPIVRDIDVKELVEACQDWVFGDEDRSQDLLERLVGLADRVGRKAGPPEEEEEP